MYFMLSKVVPSWENTWFMKKDMSETLVCSGKTCYDVASILKGRESLNWCKDTKIYQDDWLPTSSRIKFRLCVLVCNHFEGTLPPYLSSILKIYHPPGSLHSSSDKLLVIPHGVSLNLLVNALSAILLLLSGAFFPNLSVSHLLWLNSKRT